MSIQPIDADTRANLRMHADQSPNVSRLLTQYDLLYARCPVLASDVGPEHTAARLLGYALANGWELEPDDDSEDSEDRYDWYSHPNAINGMYLATQEPEHNVKRTRSAATFCKRHAQASGMAPLDVLAAIGVMP